MKRRFVYKRSRYIPYDKLDYGYLYNWYVVSDVRNITNIGWHVPSLAEWETLRFAVGSYPSGLGSGYPLIETGSTYWQPPITNATNSTGFNGRPNGTRLVNGSFSGGHTYGHWWSSTDVFGTNAYEKYLFDSNYLNQTNPDKKTGSSLRLIKDVTSVIPGGYTGNNGLQYTSVIIDTQEWLSENLTETQYRNGDSIPNVTNNTDWSLLSTGAICTYLF